MEDYRPPAPAIDWRLAADIQRQRRAAATRADRAPDVASIKEAGPSTFFVARARREADEQRARCADPAEAAATFLRQRGRHVNRAWVTGGSRDRWTVSGLGREVTDEQLVAEADRVREGRPRADLLLA